MSTEINDGGPAFPTENERQTGANSYHFSGMTLRDYFAAQAIQAVASENMLSDADTPMMCDLFIRNAASLSYRIADAMIAHREKGGLT